MPKEKAVAALKKMEARKRQEFPTKVRDQAFQRCKDERGVPHCEECGSVLPTSKRGKHFDHIKRDVDGGKPTLANCAVLCTTCHTKKTGHENVEHSKAIRARAKHEGSKAPPKQQIPQRPKPDKPPPKQMPARVGGIYARFFGKEK